MNYIVSFLALAFVATVSAAPKSLNRCADVPSGTVLPSIDCQFYVVCQRGQEMKVRCQPIGTFFDVNRQVCDKRPKVTCWDGNTSTESAESTEKTTVTDSSNESGESSGETKNTNRCKDVPSGTILSSRQCQFYVVCQRGQEVQAPVTTGELTTTTPVTEAVTEEVTTEEIITEESTTTEPTTTEPATTAAPPNFAEMCRGVLVDVLPHPTDSNQFVVCIFGRYQLQQCPEGQIFKTLVRACAV
ncbi:hypothetical protein quinque_007992 [Culex quinquefasciatus]